MTSLVDLVKASVTEEVNGFYLVLPKTLSPAEIDTAKGYLSGLTPEGIIGKLDEYGLKSTGIIDFAASDPSKKIKMIYMGDNPKEWLVLIRRRGVTEVVSLGSCGYVQKKECQEPVKATGASQAL